MISNLIISINSILPVFLILFFGVLLRKNNIMSKKFAEEGSSICFKVILPLNLFLTVLKTDITQLFDMKFITFSILSTTISFVLLVITGLIFIKDKKVFSVFVQGGFRGNFAYIGLPIIYNIVEQSDAPSTALVLAFVVPLYNILSTIILTVSDNSNKKVDIKKLVIAVFKNPIIIGVMCGFLGSIIKTIIKLDLVDLANIPANASNFDLFISLIFSSIHNSIKPISTMATTFALICLGGNLETSKKDSRNLVVIWASVYKTILQPLIFIPIAYYFGFSSNDLVVMLVMFATPTAVTSYAMAVQMNCDGYVASNIIILSNALSIFSLTFYVYIFKVLYII